MKSKKIDDDRQCKATGYKKQSLQCANCRYNRVKNAQVYYNARNKKNKASGSVCVAPECLFRADEVNGVQILDTDGTQISGTNCDTTAQA